MEKSLIIAGLLDIGRKARSEYLENNNEEARQVNEVVMGAASLIGEEGSAMPHPQPVPGCFIPADAKLLEALEKMIEKRKRAADHDPFANAMLKAMVGPLAFALPKAEQEAREEASTLSAAYNRLLGLLREGKTESAAEPMAEVSK